DCVCAIEARPDGLPGRAHVGWLDADRYSEGANTRYSEGANTQPWRTRTWPDVHSLDFDPLLEAEAFEASLARTARAREVTAGERAILVSAATKGRAEAESSIQELEELARTAGVDVADVFIQSRAQIDHRYVIGLGKLEELNL